MLVPYLYGWYTIFISTWEKLFRMSMDTRKTTEVLFDAFGSYLAKHLEKICFEGNADDGSKEGEQCRPNYIHYTRVSRVLHHLAQNGNSVNPNICIHFKEANCGFNSSRLPTKILKFKLLKYVYYCYFLKGALNK